VQKINLMVAGRSKYDIVELGNALNIPDIEIQVRHMSNGISNPLHYAQSWPDILVFQLSDLGEEELSGLLDNPEGSRPHTIVIGPANNMGCMKLAMRAGARDYLEDPCNREELPASIARIQSDLALAPVSSIGGSKRPVIGKVTAMVSAKGGAGASFLAANLAHIGAVTNSDLKVALLDLDLQFGSLAQYLDIHVNHGLMEAVEMADQLDSLAVDAYMSKHSSGMRMLSPAEDEIILPRDIVHKQFGTLLDLLKSSYDHIVIDLPRQIDELSADVYEHADHIMIVTQQEVASIRDARRLHTLIRNELSISEDRFYLIVNRFNKNSVIEMKDISKSTGIELGNIIQIPNSYQSVAESINVGVPIYDHDKSSRVTRALQDLNSKLIGMDVEQKDPNVVRRVLENLLGG
jgi:pilus assembly protein CpaE